MNKRLVKTSVLTLALSIMFTCGCGSKDKKDQDSKEVTQTSELSEEDINRRLHTAGNNATDYWNEVVCEVSHYSENGKSATGQTLDIEFVIANMDEYFSKLGEDKTFVDGLGDEYKNLINAYDLMYEKAVIINDKLKQETPKSSTKLDYADEIDLFHQYYLKVYELIWR